MKKADLFGHGFNGYVMDIEFQLENGPFISGMRWRFSPRETLVCGRNFYCNIPLSNDPYVSHYHFEVSHHSGKWMLRDLDSNSGTLIDCISYGGTRRKIPSGAIQDPDETRAIEVHSGQLIRVGTTTLRIQIAHSGHNGLSEIVSSIPDYHVNLGPTNKSTFCMKEQDLPLDALLGIFDDDARTLNESTSLLPAVFNGPSIPGYTIVRRIGFGRLGDVYEGVETLENQAVAIKVFKPKQLPAKQSISHLREEMSRIAHAATSQFAALLAHGKSGRNFYFVSEYISGGNLADWVAGFEGPVALQTAAPILLGALNALAFFHLQGLAHRELKPHNILIVSLNPVEVKLADYGVIVALESAGLRDPSVQTGREQEAPLFWAGEHLTLYRNFSRATDVFEMAAIFYWVLTGDFVRPDLFVALEKLSDKQIGPTLAHLAAKLDAPVMLSEKFERLPHPVQTVLRRALFESQTARREGESETRFQERLRDDLETSRFADARAFRNAFLESLRASDVSLDEDTPDG